MTPKDKNVQFRITEEEYELLQEKTEKSGFKTISEYLRHVIKEPGQSLINEKLDAILKKLDKEKGHPQSA